MAVQIPYVRDLDFDYGSCVEISPRIRRVIANNPSAFTFHGTGTYILGKEQVAIIDPGPLDSDHIDALLDATKGEEITHIFITHTHMDHSPGCRLLLEKCAATTYGYGPHGAGKLEEGVVVEEGGDSDFTPDIQIRHGDVIEGNDWSVECVYTPGHTSNHMCYQLREERALFSGDHVMGWSTSVISPADGDMAAYMNSLNLLLDRDDSVYWPTHGPSITHPKAHVSAFITHREERLTQIRNVLRAGESDIQTMVPGMYKGVDERLYPAAGRSVFAALQYLVEKQEVVCDGNPNMQSLFRLRD